MSMCIPGRAAATTDPTLVRDDPPPLLLLYKSKKYLFRNISYNDRRFKLKFLCMITNNFLPNVGCCSSRYDCN